MSARMIKTGAAARAGLLAGINEMGDAVRVTLGPLGRNVAMHQKQNLRDAEYSDADRANASILVTNDGVTIARSLVFSDPLKNMGAELLRQAAVVANDEAGDGTTTAIVLAQAILARAFQAVAAGSDALAIRRGIQAAGERAASVLQDMAHPVDSADELAKVATISAQDAEIGKMVGDALAQVGREGILNVDDSSTTETTLDVAEGIVFDRGLLSPNLATDAREGSITLERPYILLTDKRIETPQELIPALICAAEDGRDFLVVSDGLSDAVLGLLIENKRQGDMGAAAVLAPEYGEGRRWRMDDLAVQLGAVYVSEEMGVALADVTRDYLGSAERVRVDRKRTTITGGAGDPAAVVERIKQLRYYAENTSYEFNRKRHAERLAKFVSGVATIRVGGYTTAEHAERKMRVEDAVLAARAAYEGGVVPGGGVALYDVARGLDVEVCASSADERVGARILADALGAPLAQIAENAGRSGAAELARMEGLASGEGFDARTGEQQDMLAAGIADPLVVTKTALEAALSVATTVLISDVSVTGEPKQTIRETMRKAGVR